MSTISTTRAGAMGGRFRIASPAGAAILGVLVVLLMVAALPLGLASHQVAWSDLPQALILIVPFASVGVLVARRQPRNPIGWILIGIILALLVSNDLGQYAVLHYRDGDHGLPFARVAVFLAGSWLAMVVLLPLPIALFPDGKLPSPRWRWVLGAYLAVSALFLATVGWQDLTGVLARDVQIDSSGELKGLAASGTWLGALFISYAVLCVTWLFGLVVRYRRSIGPYRQQLKWLLSGAAICVLSLILGLQFGGSDSAILQAIGSAAFLGIVALPIGIGVGILRYRLYEIDRLISRTLSYAVVTALLGGGFLGLVVLTTDVLPFSSPVGVAASTLAGAALFNPLRRRVQHLVDRRFNRARYDAEAIVSAFSARLRDAVDLGTIGGELLDAAGRAVEPTSVSLWVRPPDGAGGKRASTPAA